MPVLVMASATGSFGQQREARIESGHGRVGLGVAQPQEQAGTEPRRVLGWRIHDRRRGGNAIGEVDHVGRGRDADHRSHAGLRQHQPRQPGCRRGHDDEHADDGPRHQAQAASQAVGGTGRSQAQCVGAGAAGQGDAGKNETRQIFHRGRSSRADLLSMRMANSMHRAPHEGLERLCMASPRDWIRLAPRQPGIERLEAYFAGHGYDPHRHDTYAIGVTLSGVQLFDYRGATVHSHLRPGHHRASRRGARRTRRHRQRLSLPHRLYRAAPDPGRARRQAPPAAVRRRPAPRTTRG